MTTKETTIADKILTEIEAVNEKDHPGERHNLLEQYQTLLECVELRQRTEMYTKGWPPSATAAGTVGTATATAAQ